MNKEVVLAVFNGRQDSTAYLSWVEREFRKACTLSFLYGQKHRREVDLAREIACKAGVESEVMGVSLIDKLGHSSLTDIGMAMDEEKPVDNFPNAFAPGRNLSFLSIAAIHVREKGISHIVTGMSRTDFGGYPDCQDTSIKPSNVTLNFTMDGQFVFYTPLMWIDKTETWALVNELEMLDLVRHETLTCYNGISGDGCGHCPVCKLRCEGLERHPAGKG